MPRHHSPEFLEFARNNGLGIADLTSMESTWQHMLGDPLEAVSDLYGSSIYTNKRGGRCQFDLGYIKHNRTRGARSARRGNYLCAGVYTTTPAQFWECVSCLFLHPRVYASFGDPSLSVAQLDHLIEAVVPGYYWEHFQDNAAHNAFLRRISNKCPTRDWLIRKIVSYMLEFYWLHEAAHLQYGHPDLWLDRFGADTLNEDLALRATAERRTRILMERQADAAALTIYLSKDFASRTEAEWSHVATLEFRIVALFVMFNIWIWGEFRDAERGTFETNVTGEYPHSVERYDNIVRGLELYLLNRREADERVKRAWAELQLPGTMPKPSGRNFDPAFFKKAHDAAWQTLHLLSETMPSFEALEYFRHAMAARIEESRRDAGHDNLLKDLFDPYIYQ